MPRVQVLLSETLDERFAAYCEVKGHKKSTLVARLIKDHLDEAGFVTDPALDVSAAPVRRAATQRERRTQP